MRTIMLILAATAAADLHRAAMQQDTTQLEQLLAKGANVHALQDGDTPICGAASVGPARAVKLLLAAKANPNGPCSHGDHPLRAAAHSGNVEAVKALVAAGAKIDARGLVGRTALQDSVDAKGDTLGALLDAGANPNATDSDGGTALHAAAMVGHAAAARTLLDRGANVNAADEEKNTPLHVAAHWGHIEVVKLLLDRGADPTLENIRGDTALDRAKDLGDDEIIAVLRKAKKKR